MGSSPKMGDRFPVFLYPITNKMPEEAEEMDRQASNERILKIVEELKKRTAQEAYALTIQPDRTPTLFDSKFGGLPYWDLQKPYPTDPEGEKMLLLAQINFDAAKVDAPLPQKGMLQFFIAKNDMFGLDFDAQDQQNTFRVIYHETIDQTITAEQVKDLGIPEGLSDGESMDTPVEKEVVVSVTKKTVLYIGTECYEFGEVMRDVIRQVCGQDIEDWYDFLTAEESDTLYDELSVGGHWMLGYPYFTQSDPRELVEEYQRYDTLLFQMDSDGEDAYGDYVLWGDSGVGNFFIAREDLEKCDFSRVLYNWDCC